MSSITEKYKELRSLLAGKEIARDRMREDYYLTFCTPHGRRVFTKMLIDLHFFDGAVGKEEIALSNYARRLLFDMGVLTDANVDNLVSAFVKFAESKQNEGGLKDEES